MTGGIDYCAGKIIKPKLEFRALRIALSDPGLRIVVSGNVSHTASPDTSAGSPGGTIPAVRVSSFVRDNRLLAGINTAPFAPIVTGKEGTPLTIVGLTVAEGRVISPPDPRFDALIFYYGGGAAVRNQGEAGDLTTIQNAVGGFYGLLAENRLTGRALQSAGARSAPRHPRSAAGLSADGNFLYLLVIDGRQVKSAGATEAETGILLRQLGASEGINLDGGGSTALALRYPDGVVRAVNTPIHGGIPGRERAVASCLGIGLAPKAE
jgi:exopolysaccharide biosynthesis protein